MVTDACRDLSLCLSLWRRWLVGNTTITSLSPTHNVRILAATTSGISNEQRLSSGVYCAVRKTQKHRKFPRQCGHVSVIMLARTSGNALTTITDWCGVGQLLCFTCLTLLSPTLPTTTGQIYRQQALRSTAERQSQRASVDDAANRRTEDGYRQGKARLDKETAR